MTIPYLRVGDTIMFGATTTGSESSLMVSECPQCHGVMVPNVTPDPKAPGMRCTKCSYMGK